MPPEQTPPSEPYKFNFWETDPKKNFAPWFLIFCAILIVIGVAIVGWLKYEMYQSRSSEDFIANDPPCGTGCAGNNSSETSTWQTYRNEEYGFEVKIPSDWTAETSHRFKEIDFISPQTKKIYNDWEKEIMATRPNYAGDGGPLNSDIGFSSAAYGIDKDLGNVNIGYFSWHKYESWGMYTVTIYEISKNGTSYNFNVYNPEKEDILNQILSTFRFIEPTPQGPVACTADAMMCPNGSYVGRTGPKCEFVCP